MPDYKSVEEAIKYHVDNYRSDGDAKGMYIAQDRHANRINKIMDAIPEEAYMLDIGCNTGGLSRILMSRKGCFVKGVDVVPELVELAVQKGVCAQVAPAEKLPFRDDEFEAVLCAETLEHLYDADLAMKEIVRVLQPGGVCVGSVPFYNSENERDYKIYEDRRERYHKCSFSEKSLYELLKPYLKNIVIEGVPYTKTYSLLHEVPVDHPQWLFFKGFK